MTGSDRADSPFARALAADGVLRPRIGHAAENVPAGDDVEVFQSSAIDADNVERQAALERGLRVRPRADLLGELSRMRRTIAVAGAHGKTTTSTMIASALRGAGLDPGYLIGGTLRETGRNGEWGTGEWLVVEADESDRSMLALTVEIAVLTSVELDHHATFGSRARARGRLPRLPGGRARGRRLGPARAAGAALGPGRRLRRERPDLADGGSRFTSLEHDLSLRVPGASQRPQRCSCT